MRNYFKKIIMKFSWRRDDLKNIRKNHIDQLEEYAWQRIRRMGQGWQAF